MHFFTLSPLGLYVMSSRQPFFRTLDRSCGVNIQKLRVEVEDVDRDNDSNTWIDQVSW